MADWTITPQAGSSPDIYSDTTNGTTIAVALSGPGSARNATGLAISLTSDQAGTTPVPATVAMVFPVTGASDISGNVVTPLTIILMSKPATLYLKIAGTGDSGTLQLTPHLIKAVTLTPDPARLQETGSFTVTASPVENDDGTALAAGVPLVWTLNAHSYQQVLTRQSSDDATVANTTSYKWQSNTITTQEIKHLGADAATVSLSIGAGSPPMSLGATSVPIQPLLAAPEWGIQEMGYGNVVTQALHDSYETAGYPVSISPTTNGTFQGDLINLYAYDPDDLAREGKYSLQSHVVTAAEAGTQPLLIYISVDTPPLNSNGNYNLAYMYLKGGLQNLGDSEPTPIVVELDNPNPYGPISEGLTTPRVTPSSYNLANENNKDSVTFTVTFDGSIAPRAGDTIEPTFRVVGYTLANFNEVTLKTLPKYTITADDIANKTLVYTFPDPNSVPRRTTWTYVDLAGIDGSNGSMFYKYQPAGQKTSVSSPTRPWTVDTVAPYSGEEVMPPEIRKAREAVKAKLDALKK